MTTTTPAAELSRPQEELTETASFLAPIEKPKSLMLKVAYWYSRRMFGKVGRPFSVFSARMPSSFVSFYGKVSRLDRKLRLPAETVILVRERVASLNGCLWCMDASRWYAVRRVPQSVAKLDALDDYRTSPLFSAQERAALAFATEVTEGKSVAPETFAELARHYSEREICDIVWLIASEHLYNKTNVALNIHSDGLCAIWERRRS
jgi:alkylhydroperoxidase family enzyme